MSDIEEQTVAGKSILRRREEHMDKIPSKREIIKMARLLATPIDFKELEKAGIIEKKGTWYKVKKPLPKDVSVQVTRTKFEEESVFVQFPKSWKKAQQLYRQMAGKEYNE